MYGQLCWSNQSLIEYLIKACASFLTAQPHATILSASQNDNSNFCQSPEELAINEAEGSPIGAMLRGVNAIAKALGPRFPHVGFDTLGNYPGNEPIPRITKPEKNVIIRLCNGGGNGSKAAALTDPINAAFAGAVQGWYKLAGASARLYIWNYAVDFGNPTQSYPNYYALGPDIQFFAAHGVRGVFEEGPGMAEGDGSDLEELKDYVMAEMLWDPSLDPDQLIAEFLLLYYGPLGAPYVRLYMDTMWAATRDVPLSVLISPPPAGTFGCYPQVPNSRPANGCHPSYLTPMALLQSARAFAGASVALADDTSVYRGRLERAWMANLYTVLWRWDELRAYAKALSMGWPLPSDQQDAFEIFGRIYNATGTRGLSGGCSLCDLRWLHSCVFLPATPPCV